MTTSPTSPTGASTSVGDLPLRLELVVDAAAPVNGAWWPRSRELSAEAADLVDNFPPSRGRINRLLFSRPDWDDATTNGRGLRRIRARRGDVKVGSFPRDDTHLMILTMASGQRLRLVVVPSDTETQEGERRMRAVAEHGAVDGTEPRLG